MSAADLYKEDRKHAAISYAVTIFFHAALLILLWYFVIMPPNPPLGENGGSGSLISLGFENMGGPELVPVENSAQPTLPQPETTVDENKTLTQETEDAPVVENKPETKVVAKVEHKKDNKKLLKKIEKPRKVDQRALFKKTTTQGEKSGSGKGLIPGNEGRQDGNENGKPDGNGQPGDGGDGSGYGTGSGTGNGSGDGVSGFELRGRSLSRRPDVKDNSRETGKVVVAIVVDRTGKVTKATPGQKGTTTLSQGLLEKAKQGALEARFSPKPDGPEEQFGTMTFIFRFKQ